MTFSTEDPKDLDAVSKLLVFLEKTGNRKAHDAILVVFAIEQSIKFHTTMKDVFDDLDDMLKDKTWDD